VIIHRLNGRRSSADLRIGAFAAELTGDSGEMADSLITSFDSLRAAPPTFLISSRSVSLETRARALGIPLIPAWVLLPGAAVAPCLFRRPRMTSPPNSQSPHIWHRPATTRVSWRLRGLPGGSRQWTHCYTANQTLLKTKSKTSHETSLLPRRLAA
jgi:hypothetical protein